MNKRMSKLAVATLLASALVFPYIPGSTSHAAEASVRQYGIESLDLGDFNYYEFEKSSNVTYGGNYYKYGTGMSLKWLLPPEVKEGDSFTLTLPPEVHVDAAPNASSVWFPINETGTQNPILNVYFVERNAQGRDVLKFVATSRAQQLAAGVNAIEGTGTIGIPAQHLISYYNSSIAASGDEGRPPQAGVTYYQGFRPARNVFNKSPIPGGPVSTHRKTLTYDIQYKQDKPYTISDDTSVSYRSEVFKSVSSYIRYGDLSIQAEEETDDSVTYGIIFNAAGTGIAAGSVTKKFALSNRGFAGGATFFPVVMEPYYNHSWSDSMEVFEGTPDNNPVPANARHTGNGRLLNESNTSTYNPATRITSADFEFPNNDSSHAYYVRLKMRKLRTVESPSGGQGWFMPLYSRRTFRDLLVEDFYTPTSGSGAATVLSPPPYSTNMTLKKQNEDLQDICSTDTQFRLVDNGTLHEATANVVPTTCQFVFRGLLEGHSYSLTETVAPDGYIRNSKTYQLEVARVGDELAVITGNPDIYMRSWNDLRSFRFINRKIARGSFKVVHKYYANMQDLEVDRNPEYTQEIPVTSGTTEESYAASAKIDRDPYTFVKVLRSDNTNIRIGADGASTLPGRYIANKELVVTYYYVRPAPATPIYLLKTGIANDGSGRIVPLDGSRFEVYADNNGSIGALMPNALVATQEGDRPSQAQFKFAQPEIGQGYWLVEREAPLGHQLLAQPVYFSLSEDGRLTLGEGSSDYITASQENNTALITVRDVEIAELPVSGGWGGCISTSSSVLDLSHVQH